MSKKHAHSILRHHNIRIRQVEVGKEVLRRSVLCSEAGAVRSEHPAPGLVEF